MSRYKGIKSKIVHSDLNPVFHLQTKECDAKELSPHLIKLARRSGQLNLSGRGLGTAPEKIWEINDLDEAEIRLLDVKLDRDSDGDRWWEHEPLHHLDLSSNSLTKISSKIQNLSTLTTLNLQDNGLESLPCEIGNLQSLTKLNVNYNKLTDIPNEFFQLRELKSLAISHNFLESLSSDGIGDLIMLENLEVSHNKLTVVPPGVGFLTRLKQLSMSHNDISDLPPDIGNLRVLQVLDLSYNKLTTLPPLGELRKLEMLYLQHNLLSSTPDLVGCACLKEAHFSDNSIKDVQPEVLENLPHLKVLNLRDNKLDALPDEVSSLRALIRLDLANNTLTTLPSSLGLLPHLQALQVEGNPLRGVRNDIIRCGTVRLLRYLRERWQSEGNTIEGEDEHGPLPGGAPDQSANGFPDRYNMLRGGKILSLANKSLATVPAEVFEEAKAVDVYSVDVSRNIISEVPSGMKSIPSCVKDLPSLEILIARDNQITDVDLTILNGPKFLATLDLSNNDIHVVPPELGLLEKLRCLELSGNPFRVPRHSVLSKGTPAILSYLRDRIPH
ncbi:leucine-rich repeat-containing protein 40-like isoform X2 [Ischnura elegans]|uniref:leucine-rich repeat-containing protein 40-like isoform X2 n=1 Tax=Ischnura elegans TaxID=197161 RepID=UPI001ED88739|nr:leucine-rich repeat-containing protein 40-like isoform X2 [Ischnura elegans]